MLAEDASRGAEHLELGLQPLGRREVAAIIPERRVVALGGVIMEHEEIADIDIFAQRHRVVAGDRARIESTRRKQCHQPRDPRLHEVDAGRFERFEEAAGERSEEHTSELQSLMRISYAVFCLKKKKNKQE